MHLANQVDNPLIIHWFNLQPLFSGGGREKTLLGDREHGRAVCPESKGDQFSHLWADFSAIVSHRAFSGGDHEVVEGGVVEAEHLSDSPHQQGQIRCPLVYQGHPSEVTLDIGCISLIWQNTSTRTDSFVSQSEETLTDIVHKCSASNWVSPLYMSPVSFPLIVCGQIFIMYDL